MKLWLAKKAPGLIPADEEAERVINRMTDGECAQFTILRVRSVQWHRMYFGICESIGQNQEPARDKDSIDHELRIRAGHFEAFFVDGKRCRMAKRIAFDKLTADEWAKLWPSLELAIRETYGEGYLGESQRTGTW